MPFYEISPPPLDDMLFSVEDIAYISEDRNRNRLKMNMIARNAEQKWDEFTYKNY